ncbi:unnamed protein product [Ilex paraguariensis]|uniref:Uncharacterized protein n=1 Tax=Ilex paraguariensis TaxID=185542 RepID=A0ABC8RBX2_9AQUA
MYPKVKVRDQEEDDQFGYESSLQSSKGFESLSIHEFPSPAWECEDPPSIVRISGSNISNSAMPTVPASKGKSNNKKVVGDNKPNIRASSVPRPRAVLSSPDNDGVIGSKNRTREVLSGLKNHNLCQHRHTQCKVTPRPIVFGSPVDTRGQLTVAADSRKDLQGKRRSGIADQSQRTHLRKEKPQSKYTTHGEALLL